MLYLIDANSLKIVDRTYDSHHIVPEFWSWLEFHARKNVCKIPGYPNRKPKPRHFIPASCRLSYLRGKPGSSV